MVAAVFRRTLSFPNSSLSRPSKPAKTYHVRSISLPCRPHPLISQLKEEIKELRAWESKLGERTSAWLCEGLSRLRTVHYSLDDILQLPQTQELLRRQPAAVEKLLEDFLGFVDLYGRFQTSVLALKEEQSAAQVAIRRRDESKVALLSKTAKRVKVEECIQEFQQVGIDIFWGLKKKGNEEVRIDLKRMQALENCIRGIELCSERVFRSLINTRVSLLNILTQ
ncbi:unnamed protein product, partial [Vitis vinifera]